MEVNDGFYISHISLRWRYFQHGGLEFVYRASPSRWAVNGYNGIPDPFADFNATDFVFRDAMADFADVVFSSSTWPFRTQSFSFIENPQSFAESMAAFPNQDTQGLWYSYVNTGTSNVGNIIPGTGSIGCLLYTSPSPRDRQKSRMPSSA